MASSNTTHTTVYLPNIMLDSTNYPSWLFRIDSFLGAQNLLCFVDGSKVCPPEFVVDSEGKSVPKSEYTAWKVMDKSIMNMMGQNLSVPATKCVIGCRTSKEVWTKLRMKFGTPDRRNILHLKSNFQKLKKGNDTIEEYLEKVKDARDALETVGVFMEDGDVIVTILGGLPPSYTYYKTQIRTNYVNASFIELKSFLQSAEVDMSEAEASISESPLTTMLASGVTSARTIT